MLLARTTGVSFLKATQKEAVGKPIKSVTNFIVVEMTFLGQWILGIKNM